MFKLLKIILTINIVLLLFGDFAFAYLQDDYDVQEKNQQNNNNEVKESPLVVLARATGSLINMMHSAPGPPTSWASLLVTTLVPFTNFLFANSGKGAILLSQGILVIFVGLIMTWTMCTMTSYCKLNYEALGFLNPNAANKFVDYNKMLMSQDGINSLTAAVAEALEKNGTIKSNNRNNNQRNYNNYSN